MGRIVASDVTRAITPGCRTLEFLRMSLDLCAVSTRTPRETANIANGQDQHASWARSVHKMVGERLFFIPSSGLVDILYFMKKRLLLLVTRSTVPHIPLCPYHIGSGMSAIWKSDPVCLDRLRPAKCIMMALIHTSFNQMRYSPWGLGRPY